jgi:hypothetical protein
MLRLGNFMSAFVIVDGCILPTVHLHSVYELCETRHIEISDVLNLS